MSDQHVVVQARIKGIIRRIPIKTFEENVGNIGLRSNQIRNREERHSFPLHIELTPGRHTMEIADIVELRQSEKLGPLQDNGIFDMTMNLQAPLRQ